MKTCTVPIDVYGASWDRMAIKKEVWGSLPGFQPIIGVVGSETTRSALIERVIENGPAHKAGIQKGDLIVTFDGKKITTFEELQMGVESKSPGDTIVLKVDRNGEFLQIPIVVGVAEKLGARSLTACGEGFLIFGNLAFQYDTATGRN